MKIAVAKERRPGEARVAVSPDVVRKFKDLGFDVTVEKGAGAGASFTDAAYTDAGAVLAKDAVAALKGADVVLKVRRPILDGPQSRNELAMMKPGAILIGHLEAAANKSDVAAYAKAGITAFAMELMPRISRAQSMDVLASQKIGSAACRATA